MLVFNFSEQKEMENMICNGYVNENNYSETIGKLAIYNLQILGMDKEDNYDAIKEYMTAYAKDFFEPQYMGIIYDKIKIARKIPVTDLDYVPIMRSELAHIGALHDIRKEKIAFVLLAVAKFNDLKMHRDDHRVNLSNSKICKLARITMKTSERDAFMKFLVDDDVVNVSRNPKSKSKKVLFISDNACDEIVLKLREVDYEELAYNYLAYKNHGDGYGRCQYVDCNGHTCDKVIKLNPRNKHHRYCEEHGKYQKLDNKFGVCIECGVNFLIRPTARQYERCDCCYNQYRKRQKADLIKKMRERNTDVDT